ncbi:MAG: tilS, partial [Dehalococcoidia bacterium]|nr:tilS [Dehalococcoidia bacterium]
MMLVSDLTGRILAYIQKNDLLPRGETVLVGVSGGPDSVCLLYILSAIKDRLGISLYVAHLNHGLRGAEAEADAEYVAGLAESLNLPVTIERRDVGAFKSKSHLSLEEAARRVRYTFFDKVAKGVGASSVAVGHTADDQVETILLNLVRGAGMRGLRGMMPVSRWHSKSGTPLLIARPILEINRAETSAYCKE